MFDTAHYHLSEQQKVSDDNKKSGHNLKEGVMIRQNGFVKIFREFF